MEIVIDIHEGEDGRPSGTVRAATHPERRSFSGNLESVATARMAAAALAAAQGQAERVLEGFGPGDPYLELALLHRSYGRVLQARGTGARRWTSCARPGTCWPRWGPDPLVAGVDADLAEAGLRGRGGGGGGRGGGGGGGGASGSRSGERSPRQSSLDLTDRERDVALLVSRGMTNPEVAAQLYVSRKAVEYHLSNIYAKLGITTRRALRDLQLTA